MNKPEISIAMTAFRKEKWFDFYQSILQATQRTFELVIVSPHSELPDELKQYNNIKHYKDFGPPMRCAQIAASLTEGKVLNILPADDGLYLPGTIDQGIDELYALNNENGVISVQYLEGPAHYKIKQPREYYQLNYHEATRLSCIPDNWIGLNNGFLFRKRFEELGGWDCKYETCPMGLADLAIRIQRNNPDDIILSDILLLDYNWYPGDSGDHKPIFDAQTQQDQPLYQEHYKFGYNDYLPININFQNWKDSPAIWEKRFK